MGRGGEVRVKGYRWRKPAPDDLTPRPYQTEAAEAVKFNWSQYQSDPVRFAQSSVQCCEVHE